MENFLGIIYCWFESLFGRNLAEYLWGFDGNEYTGAVGYNTIGIITIALSLAVSLTYYYLINHPRFNRWWSWLIVLLVNGTINLFVGYSITVNALLNGEIADSLVYERDVEGNIVSELITISDCWGFGFSNFIVSTMFFIILSLFVKWGSRNCKYSPF